MAGFIRRRRFVVRRRGIRRGVLKRRVPRRRRIVRRFKRANHSIPTRVLGTNLPLGQQAFTKMRYIQQFSMAPVSDGGGGYFPAALGPFSLNGLADPPQNGTTDNRTAKFIGGQFENYRVLGLKYKIIGSASAGSTANFTASWVGFAPFWSDSGSSTITTINDLGHAIQKPYFKWKPLNFAQAGAPYTVLKGYVPVVKFRGTKNVLTEDDYAGTVSALGTFSNPAILSQFNIMMALLNGGAYSGTSMTFQGLVQVTYYVQWFNPSQEGEE